MNRFSTADNHTNRGTAGRGSRWSRSLLVVWLGVAVLAFAAITVGFLSSSANGTLDAGTFDAIMVVAIVFLIPAASTGVGVFSRGRRQVALSLLVTALSGCAAATALGLDSATAAGLCSSLPCPVHDGSVALNAVIGAIAIGAVPSLACVSLARAVKHRPTAVALLYPACVVACFFWDLLILRYVASGFGTSPGG